MQEIAGVQVHIEGEGEQTVLMVHGWPDTWRLWDAQVAAMRATCRCVRFTLPGFDHDAAIGTRRARSLADIVELIRQIVEQVNGGRPVVLMVHDWGCLFGYQFAMLHPQLVARIIGIDIGDAGSNNYARSLTIKARAYILAYQGWLALAWCIGTAGAGGALIGDRMTRFMARLLRAPGDPASISAAMNYPYYIRWTGTHGSYNAVVPFEPLVPMLFIFGNKKPFMFHSVQWVQTLQARQGSRVVGIRAGHWMMRTRSEEFNQVVLDWLAQTDANPESLPTQS